MTKNFPTIDRALRDLRAGRMIVVVDDADRENEGDLVMAAEHVTTEDMAFIIQHTGGVVCLALPNKTADRLHLPLMVTKNTSKHRTPYTVSIDAAKGITTGISAADRTKTVRIAGKKNARAEDFVRPGHVFPLRADDQGVLKRAGHTEAAVDLACLAKLSGSAVISELMHSDGSMMRAKAIDAFAAKHHLTVVTIADLIAYRRSKETLVERSASCDLRTAHGTFRLHIFTEISNGKEHVALVHGKISPASVPLVRVHSECLTGDTLSSLRCDCQWQLNAALEQIGASRAGILLYMRQEGRGIGLTNKIRAYDLQERKGLDTVEADRALGFTGDLRNYGIGAEILHLLGVRKLRLLTNNPRKVAGLRGFGLEITKHVPLIHPDPNPTQKKYLAAKRRKMGHEV